MFFKRTSVKSLSELIICVFTVTCTQIILTQLILGVFGFLTYLNLTVLNISVSTVFLYIALRDKKNIRSIISNDFYICARWVKHVSTAYNLSLVVLLILLTTWILFASVLLPPRGIDDITYHLTTIIEFIKRGEIFILPLYYRTHVTMPLNAELLFMWPTIFYQNFYAIGLVQYLVGLFGIVAIYSLSKLFIKDVRVSLFVALLFIFSPVVMAQSGVAYIDLIVSVFFLISLYFAIKYYLCESDLYLYLAAIAIGTLVGMKYTVLVLVLFLQLLILPALLKKNKQKFVLYSLITILCGGYWYIRNVLVFGNFFPFLNIIMPKGTLLTLESLEFNQLVTDIISKIEKLFLEDIGIESLHGGYGIIFWGIALPCSIYMLIKSIKCRGIKKILPVFIWFQILLGLILLILSPQSMLYYYPRISIFIIAIGLLALGNVIHLLKDFKLYKSAVIYSCCIFSLLSVIQFANTVIPSYRIDIPLKDILTPDKEYSNMRYLLLSRHNMAYIWETLDFISKDYSKGLNCYFAMSNKDFATPFYGSKLQNRIWNFSPDINNPPDTYIFHFEENKQVKYLGKKITIDQVLKNPEYKLIDMVDNSYLFLHRKFIENENQVSKSLMKHYENYYSEDIDIIKNVVAKLDKNIPVVTSSYLGFVFTYLKEMKITDNDVYTVPVRYENEIIDYYNIKKFYTLGFIPQGFNIKHIGTIRIGDHEIKIYENELESI